MPVGAATSEQSSGESITHFGSVRVRVVGNGQLQIFVQSLNDINSKSLAPIPLAPVARYAPTRLVNFVEQRAAFTFRTINKGETFSINRIVIFTKEIYKSFPGS